MTIPDQAIFGANSYRAKTSYRRAEDRRSRLHKYMQECASDPVGSPILVASSTARDRKERARRQMPTEDHTFLQALDLPHRTSKSDLPCQSSRLERRAHSRAAQGAVERCLEGSFD